MTYNQKSHFKALNMVFARELYDYYHSDLLVSLCRENLYSFVFKGGIDIEFAKGMFKRNKEAFVDDGELVDVLEMALDYKFMFGAVPYKIIESEEGNLIPVIPQFGFGTFIQIMNDRMSNPEMYFIKNEVSLTPFPVEFTSKEKVFERIQRDGFHVFVWPKCRPDFYKNRFNSQVSKIYREFLRIEEEWENTLHTDYNAANPPIFISAPLQKKDASEFNDDEIWGPDDNEFNLDPQDRHTERRDALRTRSIDILASNTEKISRSKTAHRKMTEDNTTLGFITRKRYFEENMYTIPEGNKIENAPVPKANPQMREFIEGYEERVCAMMGIPRSLILGNGKLSRSYSNTTGNEMIQQIQKASILGRRKDASLFYRHVYAHMYGEDDKVMMGILLYDVEKERNDWDDNMSEAGSTTDDVDAKKKVLSKMNSGTAELIFLEDPFLDLIPEKTILTYLDRVIMTSEEAISLLRKKIGLSEPDNMKQLVSEMEKRRKETQTPAPKKAENPAQKKQKTEKE
jgi:hypothetical protein